MRPSSDATAIHPWTLEFGSDALEAVFRREHFAGSLRQSRAVLLLGIGLYTGYGVLDLLLFPADFAAFLTIRAVVVGLFLGVLATSWSPAFPRWRSGLMIFALLIAAGGILAMLWVGGRTVETLYYVGLAQVIIAALTLFRIRFPRALAVSLAIIVGYDVVLAVAGQTGRDVALTSNVALMSVTLIGAFACYNLEKYARRGFVHERAIETERARSERLLLNVLPAPVAERLKARPGPIADGHGEATVLFADIVDFSALSARLAPETLVGVLNEVFTEFDRIAATYGVEKIKTMGDAYMAVAGVPLPAADHAERIVEAARAMLAAVERRSANGGPPLQIRIGIATGPVVAGVIGEAKFIYDLWGEPVTMASRMQSSGVAGRIQATAATVERLGGVHAWSPRGEIDIKGRGPTAAFLLEGRSTVVDSADGVLARPPADRPLVASLRSA